MTKFAFEIPIKHLEDFDDLQDFHFALSFLFVNTKYKNYHRTKSLEGKKAVWIDNSWNETGEADDPVTMSRLYREIMADKVFAPDDMRWDKYQLASAFQVMTKYIPANDIIVVVKSPEEQKWLSRRGATNFAIPFRYRMTKSYKELEWCKNYHFLGMNTIEEIKTLKPPSLDTSFPIRMAIYGWTLDDWIAKGQPRLWHKEMPNYYDLELTYDQLKLARQNIVTLKEVCNE